MEQYEMLEMDIVLFECDDVLVKSIETDEHEN